MISAVTTTKPFYQGLFIQSFTGFLKRRPGESLIACAFICLILPKIPQLLKNIKFLFDHAEDIKQNASVIFKYILKNRVEWEYREFRTKWLRHYDEHSITTYPITVTSSDGKEHKAFLRVLGKLPDAFNGQVVTPIIGSHGDHSHDSTLLPIFKTLAKTTPLKPIMSLYLPEIANDANFDIQCQLFQTALEEGQRLIGQRGGVCDGFVGFFHSKTAIIAAYIQFVINARRQLSPDIKMKAFCSIAGRLNYSERDDSCPTLRSKISEIYQGILKNPSFPIVRVVPFNDQVVKDRNTMAFKIRPDSESSDPNLHFLDASHLDVLFHNNTKEIVANLATNFYPENRYKTLNLNSTVEEKI